MKSRTYLIIAAVLLFVIMLVTAWQARQRDQEILDAFEKVDKSMQEQHDSLRSGMKMAELEILETKDDRKIRTWRAIHALTDHNVQYIDSLAILIQSNSTSDEDIDVPDRILIQKRNGLQLYRSLQVYKTALDSLMQPYGMEGSIPVDLTPAATDGSPQDTSAAAWVHRYFHMVPSVAAITILHELKNNLQASEYICTRRLLGR